MSILLIDPDDTARAETVSALEATGLDLTTGLDLADARDLLSPGVECVVTEADLPDGDALDVARVTREVAPDATVIVFTAADPEDLTLEGQDFVVEYVQKDLPDANETLTWLVESSVALRLATAYPTPEDEDARLDALAAYAIDDAALRASLDRLTRLAAATFDVSNAAIGVVERHRQSFLACYGGEWDPLDREETVCTHAILEEAVTIVEDLHADPRFAPNDAIRDLGICGYASANITSPEGYVLGTFCVYDQDPRAFTDREEELLTEFAAEAKDQLELRRRLREANAEPARGDGR